MKFERCPRAWLREEAAGMAELMEDWGFFKKHGVLPHEGGRLAQSPRFLEAGEIIDVEVERLAKWAQDRAKESKNGTKSAK